MGLYAASSGLQEAGVITGLDLTPEAALTKLMWLLATEVGPDEVSTQMQISQRGEQSGSVFDLRYGAVPKPVNLVRMSQRPSGQFQTSTLKRAVLRLSGVGMEGIGEGDEIKIGVFVNLLGADARTSSQSPQFAGNITGKYEGPEKTVLVRDITGTVARVHETGRPINLTLVAPEGQKFWIDGVYLTLFNE